MTTAPKLPVAAPITATKQAVNTLAPSGTTEDNHHQLDMTVTVPVVASMSWDRLL
jgi:hypothetical protein